MSKEATIWIVIAIYAIFMVVIGVVNSKNSGGMASFTVGGRNAGAWISALSYGTAYFFRRYVYRVFRRLRLELRVICPHWWGIGNAVFGSLLAWMVLAGRTREVTRRLKIKSMPQLFEMAVSEQRHEDFLLHCDLHFPAALFRRPSIRA